MRREEAAARTASLLLALPAPLPPPPPLPEPGPQPVAAAAAGAAAAARLGADLARSWGLLRGYASSPAPALPSPTPAERASTAPPRPLRMPAHRAGARPALPPGGSRGPRGPGPRLPTPRPPPSAAAPFWAAQAPSLCTSVSPASPRPAETALVESGPGPPPPLVSPSPPARDAASRPRGFWPGLGHPAARRAAAASPYTRHPGPPGEEVSAGAGAGEERGWGCALGRELGRRRERLAEWASWGRDPEFLEAGRPPGRERSEH